MRIHIYTILASLLFTASVINAQTTNCLQNNFCSYDLSDSVQAPFSSVGTDFNLNYGKYNAPPYPGDVQYADEDDGECAPGTANCIKTDNGVLHYDVYYPSDYTKAQMINCPLPAVIFVHGGGFSDCHPLSPGNPNNPQAKAWTDRGFVLFNVEYRNGRRLVPKPKDFPYYTVQQQLAIYRASQDVRGAIRTIILRQRQERSKSNTQKKAYQIDTNYLFLAGNSAGSITVLNVAFDSAQALLNAINPNQGTATISQALGPIDADYYVGGTDVLYHSLIKGVLAQWGSLALPNGYNNLTAKNFFDYKVPVILFHGKQDPIVPIGRQDINFAPVDNMPGSQTNYGNIYNLETSCLATTSFKAAGSATPTPDVFTYGSDSIFYNILQPLNIPSELHVDLQMRHGLDPDGPAFKSDFGIGTTLGTNTDYSTAAAVSLYIISRACIFFQNIIGGNAQARQNSSTTHKVFIECENNRVKCDLLNDDPGCGIAP